MGTRTGVMLLCLVCLLACGRGDAPSNPAPPPPEISVTVTPTSASLLPEQTQKFTATVTGTANKAVTWAVDGITGHNSSVGSISSGGLYTASSQSARHVITATSTANPQKAGRAQVMVAPPPTPALTEVLTERYDNARTGLNATETTLTPANVNVASFGKIRSYAVDGLVFTQPLYAANVNVPGTGTVNLVFVATAHDSIYAFDADGKIADPLWHRSFIDPDHGITTVTQAEVGSTIYPEIGITSTPVLDRKTGTLYLVALTRENGVYLQRLHALDIATGEEKLGGPREIKAVSSGNGDGTDGSGHIVFDPKIELQRASLLLLNGIVYVAFASHGDNGPYHGWILGYDASTLQQVVSWNATPNGKQGGIWLSGCGLSADDAGNIYAVTGNGSFTAASAGADYGDSVVKLRLSPTDSQQQLSNFVLPYQQSSPAWFRELAPIPPNPSRHHPPKGSTG